MKTSKLHFVDTSKNPLAKKKKQLDLFDGINELEPDCPFFKKKIYRPKTKAPLFIFENGPKWNFNTIIIFTEAQAQHICKLLVLYINQFSSRGIYLLREF